MARPIILSNGRMHVGINLFGLVHDLYYPHVGLENHAAAKNMRHRVGVYVDQQISWLDDGSWQFDFDYHGNTLVGCVKAHNPRLEITLEFDDCVDAHSNVFLRNIHVINGSDRPRNTRLFMHQVFDISDGAGNGDTSHYLPDSHAIVHYRGNRTFLAAGSHTASKQSFDQHSIGLFAIEGYEGTYADANDGELSGSNVEHGRVDSTIRFNLELGAHSSGRIHYWLVAAKTQREALDEHKDLLENGIYRRLKATGDWWRKWIAPTKTFADNIDEKWRRPFILNVLLVKAHIDRGGAVMASTDSTMLNYMRDDYSYCWPRDAAYGLWPLIRLGYTEEALRFFDFCKNVLHPKGFLMHKYQADQALGSSWHPYVHEDGTVAPPIQEDETAIVLFVFTQYYQLHGNQAVLEKYYDSLVKPMADFLSSYIEEKTGLPRASYDLWEEFFLTTTYTTAVVYGALLAACELAEKYGDPASAVAWRTSADDIQTKAHQQLYNPERKTFYKGLRPFYGEIQKDDSIDISSFYGSVMFGLFDSESDEVKNSLNSSLQALSIPGVDCPIIARHENDYYCRVSPDIPGNPWFNISLWLAQYYNSHGQPKKAEQIVDFCTRHMLSTGVLPEQFNPYDNSFISVAPLMWSQAEYISTLLDYHHPKTKSK